MNIYFLNWDTFEDERWCVLVIYCCVTNYPQNLVTSFNSKHLLSHTVYVSLEVGSGFAAQFYLRTSHKMALRHSDRSEPQSSEDWIGAVRSASKVAPSPGKLVLVVTRGPSTSLHGSPTGNPSINTKESDFFQCKWSKKAWLKWLRMSALLSLGGDHGGGWILGNHLRG